MADEIIQQLGFDASQALQELDILDTKLKAVTGSLEKFASAAGNVNQVGSAFENFGKSAQTNLDSAAKATDRLTVSWGTLSRVVMTQMIVRALSTVRNEFENTASAAVDFQRKAAEIQTISPEGTTQEAIKGSIRAISDSLNIPLDRTASAYYQTLSNGITDTADALKFLNDAGKFAKATNSDLFHSVDLLSGAMKSYGMGVDDTARISSVMFEAIRAGRITADELGTTFGRVGPRAAQLGVSLEETSAALAAITVKGVKTSEAITLLNGIFTGLTKPTKEMAETLNKMGFASAESAVAVMKLPGLLQALSDSTNGSAQAIAKLFPNVRGIGGELALTGKGLKDFADNIKSMEAAGSKLTASKFLEATATDAERVTKELNKLQNALTVELGQAVLHTADDFFKLSGGADNFISIARAGVPAIAGLGTSLVTLAGSMKIASMAGTSLSTALGGLMLVPAAYGLGKSIGEWINEKSVSGLEESLKKIEEEAAKASQKWQEESVKKLAAERIADNSIVDSAQAAIRQLNSFYLQDVNNAVAASNRIVEERRQAYNKIAEAARKAEQAEKESHDRIASLQQKRDDIELEKKLSGIDDPGRKARFEITAGTDLSSKAASDMMSAALKGDTDAIKRAAQEFDHARELMGKGGGVSGQNEILKSIDQQLSIEKQIQAIEKQQNQELNVQKINLQTAKEAQKQYLETVKQEGYQNFKKSYTGDISGLEAVAGKQFKTPDDVSRAIIDASESPPAKPEASIVNRSKR